MLGFDQQIRLPTVNSADYVHDIAYDYYGTRLALCTSSLRISIFSAPPATAAAGASGKSEDADTAPWIETARMDRAHGGPIWRLSWGHPEHGEPLASCSEDRLVTIWYGARGAARSAESQVSGNLPSWLRRAQLQFDGPVVDVRFAPSTFGLKLAACTSDGKARVYECVNALDLRSWEHEDLEVPAHRQAAASSSAAIDWMPAPFGGSVAANPDDRGEILAVGGRGGKLAIWGKDKNSRWKELISAEAHQLPAGGVKDLAWCPNLCRNYEVIATCGAGAKLWRVDIVRKDVTPICQLHAMKELAPSPAEDIAAAMIWRCSWNLIGTTLALCGEGGQMSVWKVDASLEWREECDVHLHGKSAHAGSD